MILGIKRTNMVITEETKFFSDSFSKYTKHGVSPIEVASAWYQFSLLVPKILTSLALSSNSPFVISKLLKVANEEMGEGSPDHAHFLLFEDSCKSVGTTINKDLGFRSIRFLENKSFELEKKSDATILGFHLGLEFNANQNIHFLLQGLSDPMLKLEKFFEIHLVIEDQHIEQCLANFEFCRTTQEKYDFLNGFHIGIDFWVRFWAELGYE